MVSYEKQRSEKQFQRSLPWRALYAPYRQSQHSPHGWMRMMCLLDTCVYQCISVSGYQGIRVSVDQCISVSVDLGLI